MGKRGHAGASLTVAFRVHRKLGVPLKVSVLFHDSGVLSGGDSVDQK